MREAFTKERLEVLMRELARSAPRRGSWRVYLVGGGTAVALGWRPSSIDVDLFSEDAEVFRGVQRIKERLNLNIEFARPEDFVPSLRGTSDRHIHIADVPPVSFFHYDPYAQAFSKIVRGFERDRVDAQQFVSSGLVNPQTLRVLVAAIPESAYARYPQLSREGVERAVEEFVASVS